MTYGEINNYIAMLATMTWLRYVRAFTSSRMETECWNQLQRSKFLQKTYSFLMWECWNMPLRKKRINDTVKLFYFLWKTLRRIIWNNNKSWDFWIFWKTDMTGRLIWRNKSKLQELQNTTQPSTFLEIGTLFGVGLDTAIVGSGSFHCIC